LISRTLFKAQAGVFALDQKPRAIMFPAMKYVVLPVARVSRPECGASRQLFGHGPIWFALAGLLAACADTGPRDGSQPEGESAEAGLDYIFDDSELRTYELIIAEGELTRLNRDPIAEQYVRATLHVDGEEYGPIGVRYKGDYGSLKDCLNERNQQTCDKLSMKLKFNEYVDDLRFHGVKRLNLHSMVQDPSLLRDRLAYALFRDMGVAAPRAGHVELVINGELIGLFGLVEQIDGRFTRHWFADGGEGNLYKEVWPMYTDQEKYRKALQTNEDENPDVSAMVRLAEAIAAAGGDDARVARVMNERMDVEWLARYMAVEQGVGNADGMSVWYCYDPNGSECRNHNYYWYQETGREFFWLVPWDMDNTFYVPDDSDPAVPFAWDEVPASCAQLAVTPWDNVWLRAASCDDLTRALGTRYRDLFTAATEEFLAGPFAAAAVADKIDRWEAQIAEAVARDPHRRSSAQWRDGVTDLRWSAGTLRRRAQARLTGP
jgi:spore coat protein H